MKVVVCVKDTCEVHNAETLEELKLSWAAARACSCLHPADLVGSSACATDPKYYPDRQSFKVKDTRTSVKSGSLKAQGLADNVQLSFKDLGVLHASFSLVFLFITDSVISCLSFAIVLTLGVLQARKLVGLRYARVDLFISLLVHTKVCLSAWPFSSLLQVFLTEYAGPLFVYLLFWLRPAFIYGDAAATPMTSTAEYESLRLGGCLLPCLH